MNGGRRETGARKRRRKERHDPQLGRLTSKTGTNIRRGLNRTTSWTFAHGGGRPVEVDGGGAPPLKHKTMPSSQRTVLFVGDSLRRTGPTGGRSRLPRGGEVAAPTQDSRRSGGLSHPPLLLPRKEARRSQHSCRSVGSVARSGPLRGSTLAESKEWGRGLLVDDSAGRRFRSSFPLPSGATLDSRSYVAVAPLVTPPPPSSLEETGGQRHQQRVEPLGGNSIRGETAHPSSGTRMNGAPSLLR